MEWTKTLARRKFVTRFCAALGLVGTAAARGETAHAQTVSESRWQAAHHPEDAWYDTIPGVHRFVFDTISPDGMSASLGFANTFLDANKTGYGLKDSDADIPSGDMVSNTKR